MAMSICLYTVQSKVISKYSLSGLILPNNYIAIYVYACVCMYVRHNNSYLHHMVILITKFFVVIKTLYEYLIATSLYV